MEKQPSEGDQFLVLINRIIENNIDNENFSVEDLAQNVGLDQSTLHRKLKKLTGKSSIDFITEVRLRRARELLENDVATVAEVAYKVGFKDPSYFNKVFQKHYNISPGNIKKKGAFRLDRLLLGRKAGITDLLKLKGYRLFVKAIIIILIIIFAGGGMYYLFRAVRYAEKAVAVLPLHNLTGQTENAYFIDGMHDALIGELGQIKSLRVISRTSTLRYRNSDMLLQDIANELGVNIIVEGTVSGAGDSIRISIQMIDVFPRERHILANEYRDDMQNVLNIQTRAVKDIVQKIRIRLTEHEKELIDKSHTVNPETYKDYLRGMYYLNQGTEESFETGIKYMHKAIDRDPVDPFAYAGLALAYALKGHGSIAPEESFRSAAAAADRALRIDPTLDEAYTALALLYLYKFWDWPRAKKAFEDAIASNPNNEIAHAHFAWYHVLFGDMEKSLYHAKTATIIEPLSASYHSWLALLYYHFGEYDKAEISARKSLELKDDIPFGNLVLGCTYLKKEQYQKAIEVHEKLPKTRDFYINSIGYAYVKTGNRDKALAIWNELESESGKNWINPFFKGMLAGMLGYTDKAFMLLNEACEHKYYPIIHIETFPDAEFIRDDPRYNELLQKMKLPSYYELLTAQ
jgi:TolB-like protein/AraC-like DNA-binding protein